MAEKVEGRSANFGIGEFPNGLDEGRMRRVERVYGDGNGTDKSGWDVLEGVYVVG